MNRPEKPKSQKAQISMLWDAVYNHVFTAQYWLGIQLKFVLTLLSIIIALWVVDKIIG